MSAEPFLVQSARRMAETHPHRHIRIVSGSGTTVRGFVREVDEWVTEIRKEAVKDYLASHCPIHPDQPKACYLCL